ncbi:MAG: helix-turn-helix domain-containing protein [Candidatus Doudnabacteria bacterium]|nr:helix-turn-helix domain-containing protein [Candidatus Doudnabacteria bacterium]
MSKSKFPGLLTLKQVSKILNVHANTLRNWEREGFISAVRIGRRGDRRFTKAVINKILYSGAN